MQCLHAGLPTAGDGDLAEMKKSCSARLYPQRMVAIGSPKTTLRSTLAFCSTADH